MVKRKKAVTQNQSAASKSDMFSPKTPGWKSGNATMFAEPLPTPKSQMTTRRMTRRASMYQPNAAVGRQKGGDELSPISTRSRRSVYVKRLQSPKKSKSRGTRARKLAVSESVDQLQKSRSPKPAKSTKSIVSKGVVSRSRNKRHSSDISVDVNIRMPGIRRSSKSVKQSHSDPILASSTSSVALSEMSDISSVVNKSPHRRCSSAISNVSRSVNKKQRRSNVPSHDPEEYRVSRRASSKSTEPWNNDSPSTSAVSSLISMPNDEDTEITFKRSFTTKMSGSPSRKQRKGGEGNQRNLSSLSPVTSTESMDISYSTPLLSPGKRRQKTPARSGKTTKSKAKLRKSASHDDLDKAERSPAARSTKTGKSKAKLRKSASHDDVNTGESYRTPAAKLKGWSPYNKKQQKQKESSDTDISLRDVSQQASFTTPSKSAKRPMRSDELRDTPKKAVKILGKTTPSSRPMKRIKTPGRRPVGRPRKQQQQQEDEESVDSLAFSESRVLRSSRKRRASSQFVEWEKAPNKRARGSRRHEQPEPRWWQTWCTIL